MSTTWHDAESARANWADAPYDDDALNELLAVAREQVVRYSPSKKDDANVQPDSEAVPVHYRLAQLRQVQNMWQAANVDSTGGVGDGGGFEIRPVTHPLDWHVKQIIRPKSAVPHVR